ncbi:uncharacterized protein (DUF2267 family) [Catalinimonas alkaloidigena]|uniref:DUF2267 domain-containing protein n=1 Tax=Catalinimonas alkaloidigena TaxID=1075417 RepID=UPI0024060F06|nr:DUF2267 domain-containing protein [Catalinimonas alkaloidigena]MDF9797748.1 uncharacterized protein (DUF2267 family) [Catalinimonas alkaloidigena]
MSFNIDKFAQEGHTFVHELSNELGHSGEDEAISRLLRSVLHVLRDRITMSESLDLLAQLPMFLKAVYVEQWKYREKPLKFESMEEFCQHVKDEQSRMGESDFQWNEPTDELVKRTFVALRKYLTQGEAKHVIDQLPKDIKEELKPALALS